MAVTIVNETTGQTLYNGTNFTNGQVVELPFSENQDQMFRFAEPQLGGMSFFRRSAGIGVMLLVLIISAKRKRRFWKRGKRRIVLKTKFYILIILLLITNEPLATVTCGNPKTECVEPGGTRYFDTVPVTLDCWKYKVIYECKSDASNNCQQLKNQGCSPGTAICKEMWGGRCVVQEVTYDCPSIVCDGYEVVCNDAGGYCLTGDCVSHERSKDGDMAKTLAALTAAAEASKQFDSKNMVVFTGYEARCSCDSFGFIDCCADSGWGQDLNLAKCDDEDRKLARSRAEGLAALVGEYTIDHVLWKQRKKTYCVFGSKLARIVQVAGRAQLGMGFGGPQSPNCRGLTPEELQLIDFSKIDFSEVFKDIQNKMNVESMVNVNARIQQKADSFKQDPNKMLKNKQYVK